MFFLKLSSKIRRFQIPNQHDIEKDKVVNTKSHRISTVALMGRVVHFFEMAYNTHSLTRTQRDLNPNPLTTLGEAPVPLD